MILRIPDREAFFDASLTMLRQRDFTPERVDRDAGVVVAGPTTGQQWFEFWRRDSIGGYQLLESSIHTIRRIVTVHVDAAGPPGTPVATSPSDTFRVSVQVDKERYSAPERQVTTASGALAVYSERLPTTEGLLAAKTAGEHWVPLGRDLPLELYLLDKLAGVLPDVMPVTATEPAAPVETAPAPVEPATSQNTPPAE